MSDAAPSLSFFTNDELIAEIVSRCSVAVVLLRPKADRDYDWSLRTTGGMQDVLGLMELARCDIFWELKDREPEDSSEET